MEEKSASLTVVTYPIVTALLKAEEFLGAHRTWDPVNAAQRRFLAEIFDPCRHEGQHIPEIESVASRNAKVINTFLKKRGFDIQLQAFASDTFGVASVLDLLVKWLKPGEETTVRDPARRQYPAARLTKGVEYTKSKEHPHPIGTIATLSGDRVSMTMSDQVPDGLDLLARIEQITRHTRPTKEFDGLIFPMVDLNQQVNINWLAGLRTRDEQGNPNEVSEALQQTKLRMNEIGARAESAVAVTVRALSFQVTRPDMIINQPFLVWFSRPGLSKPLFAGYITQQDWKKPAKL